MAWIMGTDASTSELTSGIPTLANSGVEASVPRILEDPAQLADQIPKIDASRRLSVRFDLRKCLSELRISSPRIAVFEVVEADRGVDQALVEKAALIGGVSPEVFPGLVGFEVLPGIKKNHSLF